MKIFSAHAGAVCFLLCLHASQVSGAVSVSMRGEVATPSSEAVAAGAPAIAQVFRFFVSSNADILGIERVAVTGSGVSQLFQVAPPFGSDVAKPDPGHLMLHRALEVDSWLDTPGATVLSGTGLPGDATGVWSDSSNDGAQVDFQFAQLTVPAGSSMLFSGEMAFAGQGGPERFRFSGDHWGDITWQAIPEPASAALAGAGLMGLMAVSRRRKCWVLR